MLRNGHGDGTESAWRDPQRGVATAGRRRWCPDVVEGRGRRSETSALSRGAQAFEEQQAKNEATRKTFETLEAQAYEKMQEYEKLQAEQQGIDERMGQMQQEHQQAKDAAKKVRARPRSERRLTPSSLRASPRALTLCRRRGAFPWRLPSICFSIGAFAPPDAPPPAVRRGLQDRHLEGEIVAKLEELAKTIKVNTERAKQNEKKLAELREAAAASAVDPADDAEGGAASFMASLEDLGEEELERVQAAELQDEITELEERLKAMGGGNVKAIAEYRDKTREHRERVREFDEVTTARDAQRVAYESLRRKRLDEFMVGFKVIGMKLKEMYQMITFGGDAELELLDSLDPFSEGVVFSVRPPKKSWKNISNLSGGEKTLSSLALVFALHHYKPTPLYVMDEIDAALDFRNVSIVGNYIKERTRNAQFIIISLRNNMFELADRLVGIYKTKGCTNAIAINPQAFTIAAQ